MESPLPPEIQAQQGHKAKSRTHRGRRSRGKGAKAHHDTAKAHMAKAQAAKSPHEAHAHLFRAVGFLNKAKQASEL